MALLFPVFSFTTKRIFLMFSCKNSQEQKIAKKFDLTTNFVKREKRKWQSFEWENEQRQNSLSFLTPPLIIWNCHQRASPYHIFWKIKEWYNMYILVQTCTYFLEIITVGVMYILVQTCMVQICTWTLNRELKEIGLY